MSINVDFLIPFNNIGRNLFNTGRAYEVNLNAQVIVYIEIVFVYSVAFIGLCKPQYLLSNGFPTVDIKKSELQHGLPCNPLLLVIKLFFILYL